MKSHQEQVTKMEADGVSLSEFMGDDYGQVGRDLADFSQRWEDTYKRIGEDWRDIHKAW